MSLIYRRDACRLWFTSRAAKAGYHAYLLGVRERLTPAPAAAASSAGRCDELDISTDDMQLNVGSTRLRLPRSLAARDYARFTMSARR